MSLPSLLKDGQSITGSNGTYYIDKLIGCGGMGCVYEGRTSNGYKVAVKTPGLYGNITVNILKLETEIQILQEIESKGGHKNIVRYIDQAKVGAYPILIVEYIDGERLDNLVRRKNGLDPSEACRIMVEILDALEFLHSNNIVYRDLAPDNIMIRRDGTPVLIDFGTAKAMSASGVTRISGKNYYPPELAKSIAVPATDIYMWAATLVALLKCRSGEACIKKIEDGSYVVITKDWGPVLKIPPQDIIYGSCISSFDILKKCLEPDYNKRYKSVSELRKHLVGYGYISPAFPSARKYTIVVNGTVYELDPSKTYILGTEGDIRVNSIYVSRRHARLSFDNSVGKWVIEDMCSTNGTVIVRNNTQIIVFSGHRGRGSKTGSTCGKSYLEDGDVIGLAFQESNPSNHVVDILFSTR